MSQEMDYKGIKERVEKQLRREKFWLRLFLLGLTVVLFVIFGVMAWQQFNGGVLPPLSEWSNYPGKISTVDGPTSAMMLMTGGWLVAIIMQVIMLILDTQVGERKMREQIMGREVNREMARLGLDDLEEQSKRKGMMRLTDDGELEAVDDLIEEAVPIQQNRKR